MLSHRAQLPHAPGGRNGKPDRRATTWSTLRPVKGTGVGNQRQLSCSGTSCVLLFDCWRDFTPHPQRWCLHSLVRLKASARRPALWPVQAGWPTLRRGPALPLHRCGMPLASSMVNVAGQWPKTQKGRQGGRLYDPRNAAQEAQSTSQVNMHLSASEKKRWTKGREASHIPERFNRGPSYW